MDATASSAVDPGDVPAGQVRIYNFPFGSKIPVSSNLAVMVSALSIYVCVLLYVQVCVARFGFRCSVYAPRTYLHRTQEF